MTTHFEVDLPTAERNDHDVGLICWPQSHHYADRFGRTAVAWACPNPVRNC